MATTYFADDFNLAVPAPNANVAGIRGFKFTAPALVVNDLIVLTVLPGSNGIVLASFLIAVPGIDTGTASLLDVGDLSSNARFVNNSTVGRSSTAGLISSVDAACVGLVIGSLPRTYPIDGDEVIDCWADPTNTTPSASNQPVAQFVHGDNALVIKVDTAPTTGVAGAVFTGFAVWAHVDATQFVYP